MAFADPFRDRYFEMGGPVPVHFLGFESDTVRLGRAGWQMSVEKSDDFDRRRLYVSFAHREGPVMFGSMDDVELRRDFLQQRFNRSGPSINIYRLSADVQRMQIMCLEYTPPVFGAVDMRPSRSDHREFALDPFAPCFRALELPVQKELVVDEPTVMELYQRILDMQQPRQAEIRERRRKETPRVEAQILSFG